MSRTIQPVKSGLSFSEYLDYEKQSQDKHELVAGQLFMMAGGSDRHNRLAGRIYAYLLAAETDGCRSYIADMRVLTPEGNSYYPDVLVSCDEDDSEAYYKTQPCLIVEVLSDSTEAIDRGEKFHHYRQLATLETYVLVSQDVKRIEVFRRQADGAWHYQELGEGQGLELPCIGARLEVDVVYSRL